MERKTPKKLKGFNDFFAQDIELREYVINTFKATFEKYGYEPLETPALEYADLMVGISGEEAEKQFYKFKDSGNRDVMLRYEVMTAMTRAVAENFNNIKLPYKRYQIQKVWRSENTQKGRYREFTQCDADTIGSNSMVADGEFIQMGLEVMEKLGFKDYIARISNRKFLEALSVYFKIPENKFYGYFMSIDKLHKIGKENVIKEMIEVRGIDEKTAIQTMDLIDPEQFKNKSFVETVNSYKETLGSIQIGKEALDELLEIHNYLEAVNINSFKYKFDTTIARGLASYTGPVWEFEVLDGGVGSIAGCGRYDNTIEKYIGRNIPATGGSFGIERVCDIIKDRGMYTPAECKTDMLVTYYSQETFNSAVKFAQKQRDLQKRVMLYPEPAKFEKQLKYASAKGIPSVAIIGPEEVTQGIVKIKNMKTGEQLVEKL